MYNSKTISLKKVLWKVMNHPLATGLTYEDAAMYAIEAIELIGAPLSYINKVTPSPIEIVDYKAPLPDDLITIRGVKVLVGDGGISLTYVTDLYHMESDCEQSADKIQYYTYQIQNNVITTSFEKGDIVISYVALPLDDEGYPLIPDNIKAKMAIEYYILYRFLAPLNDIGKITDKAFFRITQEKDWYISAAQTSLQLEGIDHLESTMNAINRLVINDTAHKNFYEGSGTKEYLRNRFS